MTHRRKTWSVIEDGKVVHTAPALAQLRRPAAHLHLRNNLDNRNDSAREIMATALRKLRDPRRRPLHHGLDELLSDLIGGPD